MKLPKSFARRLNFYVLSLTVFIFLCLGTICYLFISQKETDNAYKVTTSLVENISLSVDLELQLIRDATEKASLKVFESRNEPDKIMTIIDETIARNKKIYGCGVAFEPDYFPTEEGSFMEYAYRNNSTVIFRHFRENDLDYTSKHWYKDTRLAGESLWPAPYASTLEEGRVMISHTRPVVDESGNIFAIVVADLALKDLTTDLQKLNPYDGGYSFLIATDGTYLSHPDQSKILNTSIYSEADPKVKELGERIINTGKGAETITIDGEQLLVTYSKVTTLDCFVCCITPYDSILMDLGRLTFYVMIILCLGLLCMVICMHFIIKKESIPVDIMEQDLTIARKIQEKMLPNITETQTIADKVDVSAFLRPARDVGGDMYDFFIDGDKLYFAVGDVSGKGVPAALIMSLTKSFFRSCSKGKEKADDIVSSMNASIMDNDISNMFITIFAGIIDLKTHKLSYCNAGHELPAIFSNGEKPVILDGARNLPIGIIQDCKYSGGEISFMPDDKIFIYTDGVTEAENAKGEYLGQNAMIERLNRNIEVSALQTNESILSLIDTHASGTGQSDDITILCIKMIK